MKHLLLLLHLLLKQCQKVIAHLCPLPDFGSLKNIISKDTGPSHIADSVIKKHKADKQSLQNPLSDSSTLH